MRIVHLFAASAALLLAGCASYSPVLEPTAAPKPGMAYLAGIFIDQSPPRTGLPIYLGISYEHGETGTLHTLAFQKEDKREIQAIEVPPGTYRVQGWFMSNFSNEVLARGKTQGPLFTRQLKVSADQVYFLGQYTGSGTITTSGNMIYYNATMRPQRLVRGPADEKALAARYPNIAKLPLQNAF